MWSSIRIGVLLLSYVVAGCPPSLTTVTGFYGPQSVCSRALIFADEFDEFDHEIWQHENTLAGGGNWEFQYYSNNRTNSFTEDGVLFIRPSLTSDHFGEAFLTSNVPFNVDTGTPADRCTNAQWFGCERSGTPYRIFNPIKSARIRTVRSFNFRYGYVEVRAKMPSGDWLWPAVWLSPTFNAYGSWPASGEIDIVESRGNRNLNNDSINIGTQQASSTLHFGPYRDFNRFERAHWVRNDENGFNNEFHMYQLEWTPAYIKSYIDGVEMGTIDPGEGGLWKYGGFDYESNILNPWRYGTKMAPFDQKFFIVINLAVGGVNGYFPDGADNPRPKPWLNSSPTAATDFWDARDTWLPTWALDENNGRNASLQVDYVRVWAL